MIDESDNLFGQPYNHEQSKDKIQKKTGRTKAFYTTKRLNFIHGQLDIRGMEQKLQRFAYKQLEPDQESEDPKIDTVEKRVENSSPDF